MSQIGPRGENIGSRQGFFKDNSAMSDLQTWFKVTVHPLPKCP